MRQWVNTKRKITSSKTSRNDTYYRTVQTRKQHRKKHKHRRQNETKGKPATTKNKPLTQNQMQWQDNYWDAEIKRNSTKIKKKKKYISHTFINTDKRNKIDKGTRMKKSIKMKMNEDTSTSKGENNFQGCK